MSTRPYVWRTAPTGTEGTTTVFVDGYTGSDDFGNGTRTSPYRTLSKAWNAKTTKPQTIVCRGVFVEGITEGNHECTIKGDYFGAATIDGRDKYLLYGFGVANLNLINMPQPNADMPVVNGSSLLAGVGRAYLAHTVGNAGNVYGVAGSSAILHKVPLYWGCIGGSTAVANVVYSKLRRAAASHFLKFGGNGSPFLQKCTIYDIPVTDRMKSNEISGGNGIRLTVFGKTALIANDKAITYFDCVFAADTKWYFFDGTYPSDGYEEIILSGETSDERKNSLLTQLAALYAAKGISQRPTPTFDQCIFSAQTSEQIFNDPENLDFTLVPGCDADWKTLQDTYCGALPPCTRIGVYDDSTGIKESWDERSASGCVIVDDNKIKLDTASASLTGEILSKIITIDPESLQFNGVFSFIEGKFADFKAYLNKDAITGQSYSPGDLLPVGRYISVGETNYGDVHLNDGGIIVVSQENTTFTSATGGKLLAIVEPNVLDVLYCRCRSVDYARVKPTDVLQAGATYLNDGEESITYHNRTIAPGESFVCMIDGESFTASSSDYEIAVMFDDTRVPAAEWIPAQIFGEYFVAKEAGAIRKDEYGVPLSSGNYTSWHTSPLLKSVLDRRYIQFALKVNRYGTDSVE